jgi:hypothetical protein
MVGGGSGGFQVVGGTCCSGCPVPANKETLMRTRLAAGFALAMLATFASAPFLAVGPGGAGATAPAASAAPLSPGSTRLATSTEKLAPDPVDVADVAPSSVADSEAAARGVVAERERLAATVGAPAGAPTPHAAKDAPESRIGPGTDAALTTRNQENTVATSVSNTLAEPAAAADGPNVLYSGNTYVSRSTNAGGTWVQETVSGGPPDAPVVCCDPDVVYAPTTDTTFNILLYTDAAQVNGVIRIWVRDDDLHTIDCSYTVDPGGAADNVLPDYPHLAVSDNYLYLSSNNIGPTGWEGAQMRRLPLAQVSTCAGVTIETSTYTGTVGQRIHTPVEGATTTMYWGSLDSSTVFRTFSWPESSTTVTVTTRTISASAFANPDCRGGVGDFDFVERGTSWSIAGFRLRGATGGGKVTFLWPSSPIGDQTQAHLRGVTLDTDGMGLLAEPLAFNNDYCFSYPSVSSNAHGDLGLSLAVGGKAGGGGTAAQGYIGVDDDSSASVFFPTLLLTAAGTHNRSDGRFGDYFTVRQSSRCANTWVATNFALDGGNSTSADVNARYVEFQSDSYAPCPAPK